MKIIVGLGNPGKMYEHTRHNAGFDVLSLVSGKAGIAINKSKYKALIGEGNIGGEKVVLALPQTYMNLSGESVKQLVDWYKIPLKNLLIVYDDIDLPPGKVRIRSKGGAGTHNGMRSILGFLGSEDFPRVRVGIGNKPPQWDLADWVLSHYQTEEERKVAFDAYVLAAEAAIDFTREQDVDLVMQKYNHK